MGKSRRRKQDPEVNLTSAPTYAPSPGLDAPSPSLDSSRNRRRASSINQAAENQQTRGTRVCRVEWSIKSLGSGRAAVESDSTALNSMRAARGGPPIRKPFGGSIFARQFSQQNRIRPQFDLLSLIFGGVAGGQRRAGFAGFARRRRSLSR